jgi:hypothetical protein
MNKPCFLTNLRCMPNKTLEGGGKNERYKCFTALLDIPPATFAAKPK